MHNPHKRQRGMNIQNLDHLGRHHLWRIGNDLELASGTRVIISFRTIFASSGSLNEPPGWTMLSLTADETASNNGTLAQQAKAS
jgi:hypothetical protein